MSKKKRKQPGRQQPTNIRDLIKLERLRLQHFREQQRAKFHDRVAKVLKGATRLTQSAVRGWRNLANGVYDAIDKGSAAAAKAMVKGGRAIGRAAKPYVDAVKEELAVRDRIRKAEMGARRKAREEAIRQERIRHKAKNSPTGECTTIGDVVKAAKERANKAETQVAAHDRTGTDGVKAHTRKLTDKEKAQNVASQVLSHMKNRVAVTTDSGKPNISQNWKPIAPQSTTKTPTRKPRPSVQTPIEYQQPKERKTK